MRKNILTLFSRPDRPAILHSGHVIYAGFVMPDLLFLSSSGTGTGQRQQEMFI
ncbi:hypothetical protein ACFSR6_18800 [Pedobacter vanadiisoli]|uniref:Uncharacterized protein n=1 Tax=Pedobacter vanadiisoli TaxID=1761975 RepID=A0ABW5MPY8_9SPHI